ncbi:hypothetical protein FHS95_004111 [Sphingomonas naasensis]|uniref:Homogentisate 1,2-dioxygenase n=1 Tax=Sphingomonas naasensis TaxID=1344951 RepID=A0A4V3QW01_9SPHN|nr:hypothetical protein [Sphingomonas naasensis]NIJ22396.1 hypothetical protein [Sphingomonas naasensis]TGX40612.1 hypothetical protein E5A74_13970 [Sphingomonas naasensis]
MLLAALLLAQTAPCTAMDANLPAPLAGWTSSAPHPGLMLGHATTLDISGYAAMSRTDFTVTEAGMYGVALDQGGWIDVAPKGRASLTSVGHGHGPECSTIRKIVRFALKPGVYTLTLSKLTKAPRVMLIRDGG